MLQVGQKVNANWGAMYATEFGEVVSIHNNRVTIKWDEDSPNLAGEVYYTTPEEIKTERVKEGSPIGVYVEGVIA